MNNALILLWNYQNSEYINNIHEYIGDSKTIELFDYLGDLLISEIFPVEDKYSLFVTTSIPAEADKLNKKYSDSIKVLEAYSSSEPELMASLSDQLPDFDRYIFLKSNTVGISEDLLIPWFEKLSVTDFLIGNSNEENCFLFGFEKNQSSFLKHLTNLSNEHIENMASDLSVQFHYIQNHPLIQSLNHLSRLRDTLDSNTSLARKIDELTGYRTDEV